MVTITPWGHHAPAYGPVDQALLMVQFQDVGLLHGLPWSTSCVESRFYAAPFKFECNQLLKFSPLPGFEPVNKAICYQLSYPLYLYLSQFYISLLISSYWINISLFSPSLFCLSLSLHLSLYLCSLHNFFLHLPPYLSFSLAFFLSLFISVCLSLNLPF